MLSGKIYQLYKQKSVTKQSHRISVLTTIDDSKSRKKRFSKCCEWQIYQLLDKIR